KVHLRQITAKLFVAADPFVVCEKIPAAIENQATFEDFDRFHVMRRVAVNESSTFFDQAMGECDLLRRNVIPPVAAPMYGGNEEIAWPPLVSDLLPSPRRSRVRKIVQQVHSRARRCGTPLGWNAAGC